MKNNLTNQQSLSKNKNIPSWVLGVISLLLVGFSGVIVWVIDRLLIQLIGKKIISVEFSYEFMSFFWIVYQMGILTISIVGLIRGIKEDKLLKKKSGFIGIVLCSISLILLLLMDFILLFASI